MSVSCPSCGAVASYGREIGHKAGCVQLERRDFSQAYETVTIPRAQYEALMAAAQYVLSGYDHIVPCACRLCGLRGALRAAGIETESK